MPSPASYDPPPDTRSDGDFTCLRALSFPPQLLLFPLLFTPQGPASCCPQGPCSSSPTRRYLGAPTAQLLSSQPGLGVHTEADIEPGPRVPPQSQALELGSKHHLFQSTDAKAEGMTPWQSSNQSTQAKAEGVTRWQSSSQSAQAKVESVARWQSLDQSAQAKAGGRGRVAKPVQPV